MALSDTRLAAAFAFACCSSVLCSPAAAQVTIPDEPSCADCEIRIRSLLDVTSGAEGAGLPGRPLSVAVDSRGRHWLGFEGGELSVFDRRGRYVSRVGSPGEGPGEYRVPTELVAVGDSVVIFDVGNARATVVGPDLRTVRMVRLPLMVHDAVVFEWPNRLALNAFPTLDATARPFYLADLSGAEAMLGSAFGSSENSSTAAGQRRLLFALAVAPDGTLWAADRALRYRLTAWTAAGDARAELIRQPLWMAGAGGLLGGPNTPPAPSVSFVRSDPEGNLWVFAHTAGRNWRDAWAGVQFPRSGRGEILASRIDYNRLYQTNLEVIDPRTRRVLARREYGNLFMPVGDSLLASYIESDEGIPLVRIMTYSLVSREPLQ